MTPIYLVSALLFASLSSFLSTSASDTIVLDLEGNELQPNTKYYVYPAKSGSGGGLALAARDRACPFYVMQESIESSNGLPLRFLWADKSDKAISLSADLNIVFSAATICVQSTAWRLGGVDGITGRRYVTSGGVMGRPGVDTVSNWFKLEKVGGESGYRIEFCPSVCSSCKVVCGNVGVIVENGKRWLGLSDEPLLVVFKKG